MNNAAAHSHTGHWLVLTVPHAEGVTENFAFEIAHGLRSHGRSAQVVTLGADVGEQLRAAQVMKAQGVVSIGPVPMSLTVGGTPLYLAIPGAVFLYTLDTPIYDLMKVPAAAQFIADAWRHERLVPVLAEQTFLNDGQAGPEPLLPPQSSYLPFAAFPDRGGPRAALPLQQRLLVIGALGAELSGSAVRSDLAQTLRDANTLGLTGNELARVEERLLAATARPNVVADLFAWLGLAPRAALSPAVQRFMAAADSFIKRHRRLLAVHALRGVAVDFAGPGWETTFGDQADFRFLGSMQHRHLARLMSLYRGVVNFDPNWEWGAHDRVFTALGQGVPVFTHRNACHAEEQLPAALVLPFEPNAPQLADAAHALLAHASTHRPASQAVDGVGWHHRIGRLLVHPAIQPMPVACELTAS